MNQPYARVNQSYATCTPALALREMFGVQLYKNNARALLSCILSILNLDWLQHARSVRGVYEYYKCQVIHCQLSTHTPPVSGYKPCPSRMHHFAHALQVASILTQH